MKALICALGLLATVAWTQEQFPGFDWEAALSQMESRPEHPAHGFGGYAFGSSKDFVRSERSSDGYEISDEYAGWIWYEGEIEGCDLTSGYEFNGRGQLISGLWEIFDNRPCFDRIHGLLTETYGGDLEMVIDNGTVVIEMWVPHTRIVHRKNDDGHTVSFYDTWDRTGAE